MKRNREDIDLYLEQAQRYPLLSREEEYRLATAARAGDAEARELLCLHNMRLAVKVASNYSSDCMSLLDMISYGQIGLMTAIDRFDPDRGNKLSTLAYQWIRQRIARAVRDLGGELIRVPAHMTDIMRRFYHARTEMSQGTGYPPSDEQVIEFMNLKPSKEQLLRKALASRVVAVEDEEGQSALEAIFGEEFDTEEVDAGMVDEAISTVLSPKERLVIQIRFGREDGKSHTLEETGREVCRRTGQDMTRERIRQIETDALEKLYFYMTSNWACEV